MEIGLDPNNSVMKRLWCITCIIFEIITIPNQQFSVMLGQNHVPVILPYVLSDAV